MRRTHKAVLIAAGILFPLATAFLLPWVFEVKREVRIDAPAKCVYAHVSGFILQKEEHVKTWHPIISEMQSYSFSMGSPKGAARRARRESNVATWEAFGGGYFGGEGSFYQWRTPNTNDIGRVEVSQAVEYDFVVRQIYLEENSKLKFWLISQFKIGQVGGESSLTWTIRARATSKLENRWKSVISAHQMRPEFEDGLWKLKEVIEASNCSSSN